MSENSDLMIRRANADDADLLSELGARTFSETFAADNTSEDMASYIAASFNRAQQTAELADPASTFLIAEVVRQRQIAKQTGEQTKRNGLSHLHTSPSILITSSFLWQRSW